MALFGTLVLTPDAMFMRWSEMDGVQMVAWRGLLMGSVMLIGWFVTSRHRAHDLAVLRSGPGVSLVVCQFFNSLLFCLGIAVAPVAIVLLGVAAVPVFAAVFGWLLMKEPTRLSTWIAITAVMIGIVYAVSEGKHGGGGFQLNGTSTLGAVLGLGVAVALALNFVIIRAKPHLPILLTVGCGALLAGSTAAFATGLDMMLEGHVWAMAVTGAIILPLSFFTLSLASRYTAATNVSLLMLLETVLGPAWVWLVIGEQPSIRMIWGGAVVVISLVLYLIYSGGVRARRQR